MSVIKHHDQNQLRDESVYFSSHEESEGRTWKQELMERPWRVLLTDLLFMAYSACFLIVPTQGHQPRVDTNTGIWALPH